MLKAFLLWCPFISAAVEPTEEIVLVAGVDEVAGIHTLAVSFIVSGIAADTDVPCS
jgi:hypothetical protein